MGRSGRFHLESTILARTNRRRKICHTDIRGKNISGKRDLQCKDPKVGACLGCEEDQEVQGVCSRIKKENTVGEESASKEAKQCGTIALTLSKPLEDYHLICSKWTGVAAVLTVDYREKPDLPPEKSVCRSRSNS